jgi:hypothetical protein
MEKGNPAAKKKKKKTDKRKDKKTSEEKDLKGTIKEEKAQHAVGNETEMTKDKTKEAIKEVPTDVAEGTTEVVLGDEQDLAESVAEKEMDKAKHAVEGEGEVMKDPAISPAATGSKSLFRKLVAALKQKEEEETNREDGKRNCPPAVSEANQANDKQGKAVT